MATRVILDPGRATQRPYGVAIYNSNLISTLSDIAPQDIELCQLSLADPGEVLPGWHLPAGSLPRMRVPVFRSMALALSRVIRPAGDFLFLRDSGALYHALVPDEGLPVDPDRRIVSVQNLDVLTGSGGDEARVERFVDYIRSSRAVVTTSAHLAEHLSHELEMDPADVAVVPGGVDHTRFFPRDEQEVAEVVSRYSLHRPYCLSVADSGMGAHLVDLESVADRIWRKEHIELVIVGTARGRRPGARRLGYVPREHLPALYTGAVATLTLSKYHGFPLVALESLSCGTPVVAARSEGMVEAIGGHGTFVEEGDIQAAAEAVLKFLEKRARRKASADGVEYARGFSWYKTALATLEIYRRIVAGRPVSGAEGEVGSGVEAGGRGEDESRGEGSGRLGARPEGVPSPD